MASGDEAAGRMGRRRRVAIVGAGFSGAVLAAQLLRLRGRAPEVVLIERGQRFGPGLAYGGRDPTHLLNVRAGNLSAVPDRPDHFARWLRRREGGDSASRFATRARYGAYIESVLRDAERSSWFGGGLTRVRGTAIACRPEGDGWVVNLASGKDIAADAVVLALGNPPPAIPASVSHVRALDPWDVGALKRLPRGDVLLVGSGLTMVDVALSLARGRRAGTIYALSRRGLLPRAHATGAPAPLDDPDLPANLSDALHIVRGRAHADWRGAMDQLRPHTRELWRRMPPDVQARFLRHARPWWDVHRHRAPPDIAERIAALQAEGRLKVLAGEIVSAEAAPRGVQIMHRQRGSHVRHRLEVAGVVNCTGANLNLSDWDDALVRQLLDEGVARARANCLGFDVDPEGGVISAAGAAQNGLFALGPITQGAFWEATAVPEIRVRAAELARRLG